MRHLVEDDAPELFKVVDSNRRHLREWLPWLDRNTEEAHSLDFIRSTIDQCRNGQGFVCGIFDRGDLVGTCGYHPIVAPRSEATFGYWLAESALGKGLVTRATAILIDYAFENLKLQKVCIPVAVENHKSRAVCERLELDNEGIRPKAEYPYGVYVDHVLYYTTPSSWKRGGI
ncbi:MAG: GNAT family N-acetyltransferase [Pseudomonadales bacterium]|nr:GNAT family N-acetyltransferase [Pseudomonadales bacterium]